MGLAARKDGVRPCPCGKAEISWSFTVVELDKNDRIGPRTMTVHLCRGCGSVAFDLLAEHGFLATEVAAFTPGPPELAPARACDDCGKVQRVSDLTAHPVVGSSGKKMKKVCTDRVGCLSRRPITAAIGVKP